MFKLLCLDAVFVSWLSWKINTVEMTSQFICAAQTKPNHPSATEHIHDILFLKSLKSLKTLINPTFRP